MSMIPSEHYKREIERFRKLLHEAIESKDEERILKASMELDKLIVQYVQMTKEK
ncbi:aspartyl-phosphate phosphatase Spo0E family protein [Lutispora sp.]|uniref:aspartyl-phosphate phosphatase Spo0E family protein n=1 Tax=Lutispora sp. TaxID=2828727 RepID=UPI000EDF01CD|nr:aspartyl-phosphate phosphatase Spo0E family protein [Lutispora sp.]MEA4962780.1 aspartyl-phosphate phosphatase Spo0E family protein [Lutispora sp.]HCJ56808.1 Spo0E family sporulation regulatory protein-aspartic acid phosphatase [Clostridiaceae bacterium]